MERFPDYHPPTTDLYRHDNNKIAGEGEGGWKCHRVPHNCDLHSTGSVGGAGEDAGFLI